MKFNKLQQLVAQHYRQGEFRAVVDDTDDLDQIGDTLYKFMILEAGDAANTVEFIYMLDRALGDILYVQTALGGEQT